MTQKVMVLDGSTREYPIDEATGFPEVPEGYFFRVSFGHHELEYNPWVTVELRLKRKRFGSRRIAVKSRNLEGENEIIGPDGYHRPQPMLIEDYPDTILSLACIVLETERSVIDANTHYQAHKNAVKTLAGDYPPKKLED